VRRKQGNSITVADPIDPNTSNLLEHFDMNAFSRLTLLFAMLLVLCSFISAQTEAVGNGQNPPSSGPQEAAATQQAPSGGGAGDLQKAVQNPVASLISVPVQNSSNFGIGPYDRTQNVLNFQPVIPIRASQNWNLIIRWITPVIWQPAPGTASLEVFGIEGNTPPYLAAQAVQKSAGVFGFGDMTPSFFFSPAKPGKLIWGAGPVFVLPTATSKVTGQGKLSVGPSIVALIQPGKWTFGTLINNAWSVAGPSDRSDVSQMTLQYFVNYNLKKGWYLSSSPLISANWKASSGNVWTVPVGGGVGRILRLGLQPVNITAQFYGNAAHPSNGSPWGMRLQMAFLFPKLPPAMKEKLKALQQK
jgi:hypothetical protein